jgi:hypothetical protein
MTTNTMKAIQVHDFGGPDALRYEDVPVPKPAPDGVPNRRLAQLAEFLGKAVDEVLPTGEAVRRQIPRTGR